MNHFESDVPNTATLTEKDLHVYAQKWADAGDKVAEAIEQMNREGPSGAKIIAQEVQEKYIDEVYRQIEAFRSQGINDPRLDNVQIRFLNTEGKLAFAVAVKRQEIRLDDAIEWWQKVVKAMEGSIKEFPDPDNYLHLGVAYQRVGKPQEALIALQKAIESGDPQIRRQAEPFINLAKLKTESVKGKGGCASALLLLMLVTMLVLFIYCFNL